jgi:hypothetical protein
MKDGPTWDWNNIPRCFVSYVESRSGIELSIWGGKPVPPVFAKTKKIV